MKISNKSLQFLYILINSIECKTPPQIFIINGIFNKIEDFVINYEKQSQDIIKEIKELKQEDIDFILKLEAKLDELSDSKVDINFEKEEILNIEMELRDILEKGYVQNMIITFIKGRSQVKKMSELIDLFFDI